MSHLSDSVSERNFDVNRPSSAQQSTSQPFRSKSSLNNRVQDHQTPSKQTAKKSPKHSAMSRHKQSQGEVGISSQTYTNSSVSNITTACQNININSEKDEVDQGDSPKRKNAKKKERLKQLQMPPPGNPANVPQSSQHSPGYLGREEYSSLHDFFTRHVSPMYAHSNSRYLENLSHHPQYQLAQNIQMGRDFYGVQLAASLPNTPHVLPERPKSMSIPNSPISQSDFINPQCLKNVMQHPLLSQTYNAQFQRQLSQVNNVVRTAPQQIAPQQTAPQQTAPQQTASQQIAPQQTSPQQIKDEAPQTSGESMSAQGNTQNGTPKHKKNKKKAKSPGDLKFEDYLSADEVEEGLKNEVLVEGVIRINPKQFQHSYVSSTDRSEQDILIDGLKYRNRALEGDIVVVQFIESQPDSTEEANPEEIKQKKGKVVYIKEKVHNRTCIGHLRLMPDNNRQKALFVPRDHRIPRLNIPFTSWPNNFYQDHKSYENTLFLAQILDWADTRFAVGQLVYNIGQSGDMVAETKAILAQTDLDVRPFGPEVRHLYPRLDYKIPEEEIALREDCRKLCLFSIDPSSCRDIDDAVTCVELENGNYEIGVHIADVAHFLTENTILDEKVAEKATTIYLVEKAYHMLPEDLCMLCSLFPGVDKLAFSVFWEITKDAQVLSHRFAKTVINSCAQLSYEHAQAILEDKEDSEAIFPETYNGFEYKDIYKVIKALGSLSAIFRKNRFDGGALRIDQPKLSFSLNSANGLPDSFSIYESKESHQLIEEFMLLANMTVAQRIYEDHPNLAFLRCHPPPSSYMLKQLAKALKPMGIELNVESAGDIHRSLLQHVGPTCIDMGKVMVLNMLCAKPMARAKYFCADRVHDDDFRHYALNVPLYTHFTSPIRRYADIMVHRLLAASLKYRETPKWVPDHVRAVAAQCNKMKYNAKRASELSNELYTLKYIEMNSPLITDAAVVDVRDKYIDVIIIAMGLNRRIFFNNDFPGQFNCVKNEGSTKLSKMELFWKADKGLPAVTQVIEVFSTLHVELKKDEDMVKVDVKLVRPR